MTGLGENPSPLGVIPTQAVIPAEAGIHIGWPWRGLAGVASLDPRLRGDDGGSWDGAER